MLENCIRFARTSVEVVALLDQLYIQTLKYCISKSEHSCGFILEPKILTATSFVFNVFDPSLAYSRVDHIHIITVTRGSSDGLGNCRSVP